MMRKKLLLLVFVLTTWVAFGQRTPISASSKGVCTDPAVSMTVLSVGTDFFTVRFEPNAECDHYFYVAMTDDDISMWTGMMGMTVDQLISMWGVSASAVDTFTWSDMVPNTTYNIMALPYGSGDVAYPYSQIEITTGATGGSGTSVITVEVSNVTDTSALVVCTPNDQTAMFYDGIVTVEYFNQHGQSEVCAMFQETTQPFYDTDSWLWTTFEPNTDYYVVAFGQNAEGVWGDTTLFAFSTLVGVDDYKTPEVLLYPLPNNGTFNVAGAQLPGGQAQIFAINGQLLKNVQLQGEINTIHTNLPAGSYVLHILDAKGQNIGSKNLLIK